MTLKDKCVYIYLYECPCAPLADLHANPLANVVCTQIGPEWLPRALYENKIQSIFNQA